MAQVADSGNILLNPTNPVPYGTTVTTPSPLLGAVFTGPPVPVVVTQPTNLTLSQPVELWVDQSVDVYSATSANLRRSHEDAEAFTGRLTNLRQDIAARQDTSGDKFSIELDGQVLENRGIAGELIVRRAEKIKNRFGNDVMVGRFAGFDLFLRPSFNNTVEMIVRGKNSYAARVTDTALGTVRSLEANIQGFEERAARLETDIADATKRAKELEAKVGAHFEREERYQQLTRRQCEIEEKLDLTKNQARLMRMRLTRTSRRIRRSRPKLIRPGPSAGRPSAYERDRTTIGVSQLEGCVRAPLARIAPGSRIAWRVPPKHNGKNATRRPRCPSPRSGV